MAENQPGTIESLAIEVAKIFDPMRERIEDGEILILLEELGISFPDNLASDNGFQTAVKDVSDKIALFPSLISTLIKNLKDEDYAGAAAKTGDIIQIIVTLVEKFQVIADEIESNKPYPGITDTELNAFLLNLAENIVDYLVISYFENTLPTFSAFFEFFGIFEITPTNVGSTNPLNPEYTKKNLNFSRLGQFLENPASLARELYGWGDDQFTGELLFRKLEKLLNGVGWPAVFESNGQPRLDLLVGKLEPRTDIDPKGIALVINEVIGGNFSYTFSEDYWKLEAGFEAGLPLTAAAIVQPNGVVTLEPPSASPLDGRAFVKWTAIDQVDNLPLLLIGSRTESRLEAKEISALVEIQFTWDGSKANGVIKTEAEIKDGKLVIKPGDPDGFLAKVLPPEGFTLDFNVLLGLSSAKGFYFQGSGTLEFDIPVSISLGPIEILNLTLGITPGSELGISLGTDIRAMLGPFTAVVENMGMKTTFTFPENRKGNLGPINLEIGFKPPNGIGLSLDAGVVKGGGYLMFDFDKGEYAGALELSFEGLFAFSAIGIITTKFPDGSTGFSLLLLINVTFGTPIVLGYNFYLAGVGGLIGLHRSVSTIDLQKGVQAGSLDSILFPENVIANITRIISDLKSIFPVKQDQFVLGIMLRITWNTPAILIVDAGLIIEFPNPIRICILGIIRCALPTPDEAIVELNVGFVGIIDFEEELLSFDASIFDSRILTITLEGDMALRISWGEKPDFLVSVGGFHPVYTPAAHLKLLKMKRITVNILSGNPSLVLTAYFAVTTNTIQFGAAIDFKFKVSGFSVVGNFGFDVLIQFSPFRFIAEVKASVAVKSGSSTLLSISLNFNLEGPTPWRAHGHGSFRIWFVKIKVGFDKTWGEKIETSLPSTSVLPLLIEEFQKNTNWITKPDSSIMELVTLADAEQQPGIILVRPYGSLEINQMVVPMDMTMTRFGNFLPADISKVTIKNISVGSEEFSGSAIASLQNSFAPAAFKDMSDDDKLKSPSYENQNSGVRLISTDEIRFDYGINRLVQYETILSDFEEEVLGPVSVGADFFKAFVSGGDIGHSPLSQKLKNITASAEKTVSVTDERYTVVTKSDLSNADGGIVFNSKSEADEHLRELIAQNPSKKGRLQLSPAFQMQPA